jgi:sulfofructose kinase
MKLLELASHVVFGREGLAAMAETPDIAQGLGRMREQTGAWLAVTCGGEGVYWLDDGQVRHLPAFEVEVVDTLAAGDVFHGALALALAERRPIEAALPFAAAAAAIKCTRFGGRDGIPNRAEVERLLTG